ncbi:IS66 family insertion sequence element accessory protein TnpA [Pseudoalteromonas piscicida]|uniref:IS66 family insertion sequence element accessory protein TnpA n=1 Tax=Pseudoalteromonas piscicida TaxID=43662 RepID=UPI0012FD96FE|nr:hypothetical protein [Pseudoalteromonas piscicida]
MPKHKTAQQWFTLIEQQALSGLSITDFCQQHNLSTKSFYYHRAKHHKKKAPQKSQSSFVAAQPAVPAPVPSRHCCNSNMARARYCCHQQQIPFGSQKVNR